MPHDQFHLLTTQRPYLHDMLNRNDHWGEDGVGGLSYQPELKEILAALPESFRTMAKEQSAELAAIVNEYAAAARPIEYAHWRARLLAYHQAVENGSFVVVDNNRIESEVEKANNNHAHLLQLDLGEMNRDFFYITSSSLSDRNETGQYSALIYIRRRDYPEPFRLLDEVTRLKQEAELAVRDRLGVPR